jgi:hypothetical protein
MIKAIEPRLHHKADMPIVADRRYPAHNGSSAICYALNERRVDRVMILLSRISTLSSSLS